MWTLDEELERHFDKVKFERRSGRPVDDDEDDGPMTIRNEYARGRGRSRSR